ncbi:(deoxy)nucleoside triphosphate pyrophosphohydrolase [Clostridium sp. 'White wine YQ']|uniref:(deoxy)nucleoside triphosphate pyrophosphohydrolase n=1 Tax=Clostridium sp. 'White wine YQ' TaxID=3027474 RepID=UPI002366C412|nr:(deoxy)nucleoside triphosphate pyrophosphohydrolase [Clostridium sp. 'White wine YQ']MDD7794451.1 (deoxy)nucleoside triphosphate pyrophosphohydrolase [Clostridium sp. 'White wine YQ']
MKKIITVIGAIIENENNEILCALRSPKMSLPNHWEFPSGKLEKGEGYKEAVEREIKEQLNCSIEFINVVKYNTQDYQDFMMTLVTVKCKLVSGIPISKEHSKLLWLNKEYLPSLKWINANIPTVDLLAVQ